MALIEDFGHYTYTRLFAAGHPWLALYQLAVDTLVLREFDVDNRCCKLAKVLPTAGCCDELPPATLASLYETPYRLV
ncbi:hypothetical protein LRS56_06050 [Pseudomonas poae]|nr:hypothetical protein LRS56_06050 [Pseudomonas poae]